MCLLLVWWCALQIAISFNFGFSWNCLFSRFFIFSQFLVNRIRSRRFRYDVLQSGHFFAQMRQMIHLFIFKRNHLFINHRWGGVHNNKSLNNTCIISVSGLLLSTRTISVEFTTLDCRSLAYCHWCFFIVYKRHISSSLRSWWNRYKCHNSPLLYIYIYHNFLFCSWYMPCLLLFYSQKISRRWLENVGLIVPMCYFARYIYSFSFLYVM